MSRLRSTASKPSPPGARAEDGEGELDRPPRAARRATPGQPVEDDRDADMRPPARGDDPADEGEPDHQVARELVRPDERVVDEPRTDAEHQTASSASSDDATAAASTSRRSARPRQATARGTSPRTCARMPARSALAQAGCAVRAPGSAPRGPCPTSPRTCRGTVASTGLRKLSRSGSITVMPPFLKVSTRRRLLGGDLLVLPGGGGVDRGLDDRAVGCRDRLSRRARSRPRGAA